MHDPHDIDNHLTPNNVSQVAAHRNHLRAVEQQNANMQEMNASIAAQNQPAPVIYTGPVQTPAQQQPLTPEQQQEHEARKAALDRKQSIMSLTWMYGLAYVIISLVVVSKMDAARDIKLAVGLSGVVVVPVMYLLIRASKIVRCVLWIGFITALVLIAYQVYLWLG